MTDDVYQQITDPSLAVAFIPGEVRQRTADESRPLNTGHSVVCGDCNHTYSPVKVGMYVVETIDFQRTFRPYRVWSADRLACNCGRTILRMANRPMCGEWDGDFGMAVYNAYMLWQADHDAVAFWTEGRGYRDDSEIADLVSNWLTGTGHASADMTRLVSIAQPETRQPNFSES